MAQLHFVKRARKAIPEAGIEVGDSYYFFKRRVNGKGTPRVCSKTKPRRSRYATSSPFIGQLMDWEDELGSMVARNAPPEGVALWLENVASEVEALGNECSDKAASVTSGMKNNAGATSAEMLQARAEHCLELASAIREAVIHLEAMMASTPLSENEGEDGECGVESVFLAEVVGVLVWLP